MKFHPVNKDEAFLHVIERVIKRKLNSLNLHVDGDREGSYLLHSNAWDLKRAIVDLNTETFVNGNFTTVLIKTTKGSVVAIGSSKRKPDDVDRPIVGLLVAYSRAVTDIIDRLVKSDLNLSDITDLPALFSPSVTPTSDVTRRPLSTPGGTVPTIVASAVRRYELPPPDIMADLNRDIAKRMKSAVSRARKHVTTAMLKRKKSTASKKNKKKKSRT